MLVVDVVVVVVVVVVDGFGVVVVLVVVVGNSPHGVTRYSQLVPLPIGGTHAQLGQVDDCKTHAPLKYLYVHNPSQLVGFGCGVV